jgi:hypothetical protein
MTTSLLSRVAFALALASSVAGCATTALPEGMWTDPAKATFSLRQTRVLVSCRAPDMQLALACEDHLVRSLRGAGAEAVVAGKPLDAGAGTEALQQAAREANAPAVVHTVISVSTQPGAYGSGPTMGVGIGIGRGMIGFGSGVGIGVGGSVGMPLGGVRPALNFSAHTSVIESASGREVWSLRTSSQGLEEPSIQVAMLAGGTVDAMRRAGMLEPR